MGLGNLHKIKCFGELKNPLYYCKESGKLYRQQMYNPRGIPFKAVELKEIKTVNTGGYLCVSVNGKLFKVHQVVAMEFLNYKPTGTHTVVVDHVDSDKLNNRIENLQLTTNRVNTAKGRIHTNKTSSLPLNIHYDKRDQKYQVQFRFNGRKISFGLYPTLDAATLARDEVQTRLVENKEPLEGFKSELVTAKVYRKNADK